MNRKFILYALALMNFTHIVDSMLIMPLGDIFIEEFGIGASEYSFLVSAYALAAFCSSLIGVFFLDRFDRKEALLFIYAGFGIGTLLCAQAETYTSLLLLRIVTGFFGGMIGALVLSIVSDLFLFKERGEAMGIVYAAFSAASALGVPIGIYLAAKQTWQFPFQVIGILSIAIVIGLYFLIPPMGDHLEEQEEKVSFRKTITAITGDNNQMRALTAGFFLVLAHFMIIPFISPYLIKNVGLTQMEISYQFFFGGAATIVTSPYIGVLTDRHGVMKVFTIVMLISFIPTLLITHMPVVPLAVALTFTTMFFVFGSGRMISPNTLITAAAGTKNRGSFMSVKSALQQLSIAAASLISGAIVVIQDGHYINYNYVGYLSILFGILAIYLVRRIRVAEGN